jgi:hypothetical protein
MADTADFEQTFLLGFSIWYHYFGSWKPVKEISRYLPILVLKLDFYLFILSFETDRRSGR